MKYLVFGADGFVGRRVSEQLSQNIDNKIFHARNNFSTGKNNFKVNLLDRKAVLKTLKKVKPDVIVNCAGVIANNENAILKNPLFTLNILQATIESGIKVKKIIIMGSAAEYGEVKGKGKTVKEEEDLRATSFYGTSKILEVAVALRFRNEYGLPVIVARMFNPIGYVKNSRLLISKILEQIKEISQKKRKFIEVSRLDSERDYISIKDAAKAIAIIAESPNNNYYSYNIGSRKSTINKEIIEEIIKQRGLKGIIIKETSKKPEPYYASRASTKRITDEYGWRAKLNLKEIVKEFIEQDEQDKTA